MPKDAARFEAAGAVDELSAVLGSARAESLADPIDRLLAEVQQELAEILAELGAADPSARGPHGIGPGHVRAIEHTIDRYQQALPPLGEFVLPTGVRAAAQLHVARTVCRRAERRLVTLARAEGATISPSLTAYLNRLGDLLFVLARTVNQQAGCRDVSWRKDEA